jgi:hypothetical protein
MRHDKPRIAHLTVDQLEAHVRKVLRLRREPVTYTSNGKRFSFYRRGQSPLLRVKVKDVTTFDQPNVEALAARVAMMRLCPVCKATFQRNGRQAYCTPAHAAKARKQRWRWLRTEAPDPL